MPDFEEEKVDWEHYLRSYCKTTPNIEGAALATVNGNFIASVLPKRVDKRLLAASVADVASSGCAIAAALMHDTTAPLVYLKTEFGYVFICCYPEQGKILVTLCRENANVGSFRICPDLSGPVTAKDNVPIERPPKRDAAEAEVEQDE